MAVILSTQVRERIEVAAVGAIVTVGLLFVAGAMPAGSDKAERGPRETGARLADELPQGFAARHYLSAAPPLVDRRNYRRND